MDFTRQPIIETVITPKEGCKLVVRSSKSIGQEEFFVDALEVVSFGISLFYRSLERPKAFLVPASDYEVLEVREARMALKAPNTERSSSERSSRGSNSNSREPSPKKEAISEKPIVVQKEEVSEAAGETVEKRREKRRHGRRRRGREGALEVEESAAVGESETSEKAFLITIPTLLPPPPTLIAETLARYKDNSLFRGAFITTDESKTPVNKAEASENSEDLLETMLLQNLDLEPASYSTLGPVEEEKPFPLYSQEELEELSEPPSEPPKE